MTPTQALDLLWQTCQQITGYGAPPRGLLYAEVAQLQQAYVAIKAALEKEDS